MKAVRTWTSKALSQSPCHMMAIQLAISVDERTDEEILDEYDSLVGTRSEVLASEVQPPSSGRSCCGG
jgi:hypothetical protein